MLLCYFEGCLCKDGKPKHKDDLDLLNMIEKSFLSPPSKHPCLFNSQPGSTHISRQVYSLKCLNL